MDDNMDNKFICCVVDICKHVMHDNDRRTFYRFPLGNEELLKSWINVLGLDETFVPDEHSVICSDHFTANDYVKQNGIYDINQMAIPSRRLTSDYETDNDDESINNTEVCPIYTIKEEHDTDDQNTNTIVIEDEEPNLIESNISRINQDEQSFDKNSDNIIADNNSTCNSINLPSILPSNSIRKCENTLKPNLNECFAIPVELMTTDQIKSTLAKLIENVFIIEQEKTRLLDKVKNLKAAYIDRVNKYLHFELLRYMVSETENELLEAGVDTSNYSLFNLARVKEEVITKKEFEQFCKSVFREKSDRNTASQSDDNEIK